MPKKVKTSPDDVMIDAIIDHYIANIHRFESVASSIAADFQLDPQLKLLVHSIKHRTKDPTHLRDKLLRKSADASTSGTPFDITPENLFEKVTDLSGIRIIHLHMSQFPLIDHAIRKILDERNAVILEGPVANTWDDEYKAMFESWGAVALARESMYTSVHYIVDPKLKTPLRFELQVRTLMEEVWGEVSHTVNYPHPTKNEIVKEQLKVLARFTSGCTRLVDTIFLKK